MSQFYGGGNILFDDIDVEALRSVDGMALIVDNIYKCEALHYFPHFYRFL